MSSEPLPFFAGSATLQITMSWAFEWSGGEAVLTSNGGGLEGADLGNCTVERIGHPLVGFSASFSQKGLTWRYRVEPGNNAFRDRFGLDW